MKRLTTELIQIKKTKSVEVYFDEKDNGFWVYMQGYNYGKQYIFIPMSKVFQVKRGLVSAIQRFYRKRK